MDIVIFTGGEHPPIKRLFGILNQRSFFFDTMEGKSNNKSIKSDIFVIAADSGLTIALKHKIIPDLILGDFDSLDTVLLKRLLDGGVGELLKKKHPLILRYPRDKDWTDTQLALIWAKKINKKARVILFGGSGGRLDHLFSLFNNFCRGYRADVWFTKSQVLYYIRRGDRIKIKDDTPSAIGVLRLLNHYSGGKIESKGLQWEGKDFFKKGLATSCNRIADDNKSRVATMRVIKGKFLLCVGFTATISIDRD